MKTNASTLTFLLAACLSLLAMPASAQVPQIINYQGRIAVGNANFDGTGSFKFALVQGTGPTLLWKSDGSSGNTEPAAAVSLAVTKGLYSVLLGDTTVSGMAAIPNTVFANSDVRLRVWFNDGTANGWQMLSPDQRIAAVGYAMVAGSLQPGVNISAGTVTATSFSGSGAGLTNIPPTALATPPAGMVLIPAGAFTMGDTLDGISDAAPVSTTVSAFYMDANEVTQDLWTAVQTWATLVGEYTDLPPATGGPTYSSKGGNAPVFAISWHNCVKWCNARSEREGRTPVYYTNDEQTTVYRTGVANVSNAQVKWTANGYRLPTEAEWEKAVRGGRSGLRFPWGGTISQKQANYAGITTYAYDLGPNGYNAIGSTGGTNPAVSVAGSFAPNGYGLFDMTGNVMEWCWDWRGTPYAGGTDPHGPATGSDRVLRGGNWNGGAVGVRCAYRYYALPVTTSTTNGFRTARSAGQP